ncbi:MAG: phosphoenolpyruvate--protein phosphotransferase [Candidatus Zixiibacteriota bacterium]
MGADVGKRKVVRGIPISSGIAMGQAQVVVPGHVEVAELAVKVSEIDHEIAALHRAVQDTSKELKKLQQAASRRMDGTVATVFDAQLLIATDQDFLSKVTEEITSQQRNAAYVYNQMVHRNTHQLRLSNNPYLRQSAQEIEAVADRVLSHLAGVGEKSTACYDSETVLVARSFTPGHVLDYRERRAVGFVAGECGAHSHTALIARSLLMPMVATPHALTRIPENCRIIVDGANGQVIINPTDREWTEYEKKRQKLGPAMIARIKKLEEIPPRTADGVPVQIAANLEFPGPVDEILAGKKIPVGLYRTEFLYMDGETPPDEIAQFKFYDRIAARFADSHVVFRTFDLGSDKVRIGDPMYAEVNPALGWRGIRCMLDLPEVFKTQVRAILRASVRRNVCILLPMISDLSEFRKARKLISQAMLELRRKGELYDDRIQIGVMVEVPSAALLAEPLAELADFVHIGTNDLTQYTMSADRGNDRVADLYNPFHPSVLNLVAMTVRACRRLNKRVCVCGEAAGDPLGVVLFVGMGVTGLSMNPGKVFDSCRLIKKVDFSVVKHLVEPVLASNSASAAMRRIQSYRSTIDS